MLEARTKEANGVSYDPAWRHRAKPAQRTAVGRVQNDDRADWAAAWALFPGAIAYVWHAALKAPTVAADLEAAGFTMRSQIIWVKQHFALSRGDYHWGHEPAWYAVRGRGQWCGDRRQTTVWNVAVDMQLKRITLAPEGRLAVKSCSDVVES